MDLIAQHPTFGWALILGLLALVLGLLRAVWWMVTRAFTKMEDAIGRSHMELKGAIEKLETTLDAHFRELGHLERRVTMLEARMEKGA